MAGAAAGAADLDKLARALLLKLRERHYTTAGGSCSAPGCIPNFTDLGDMFDSLEQLLRGICAVGELTPRTSDQARFVW